MEEVPNLINISSTNHIQILNQHEFFKDCFEDVSNKCYFLTKIENIDVGTGTPQ